MSHDPAANSTPGRAGGVGAILADRPGAGEAGRGPAGGRTAATGAGVRGTGASGPRAPRSGETVRTPSGTGGRSARPGGTVPGAVRRAVPDAAVAARRTRHVRDVPCVRHMPCVRHVLCVRHVPCARENGAPACAAAGPAGPVPGIAARAAGGARHDLHLFGGTLGRRTVRAHRAMLACGAVASCTIPIRRARSRGLCHQEASQAHGEEEAPQAAEEDAHPAPQQEVITPAAQP